MCAFAPFPIPNWPLVNLTGHEQNYMYGDSESIIESFLQFPPPQEETLLDSQSPLSFTQTSTFDPCRVKKLNHNASERDRRKKVNALYSSLRSLLPVADQMKKLSFPATVSHALKYIPELQDQVERLVQKKEELLLRVSQQGGLREDARKSRNNGRSLSSAAVCINRLSDSEVAIQISILQKLVHKTQFSEMLDLLEQEGFLIQDATSFESFGGMLFYNIHLQVETAYKLESEALTEKLLPLCDNREELLPLKF
ncbi:hypothetical protein PTKIN_Ptkin03bG0179900 [Pterospermum kingtungense]